MEEMSISEFARRSRLSPKALRLYDGLGLFSPARVDDASGYRYYDSDQLERARLIASLRQIGVPLATIKELVELEPAEIAARLRAFWLEAETSHAAQGDLVRVLIDRLIGRSTVMYEVAERDIPERSLLCLKRNVDEKEVWAFGKEFIAIIRDERFPRLPGREGAFFAIFWGEVTQDSDGPVEFCKPVPSDEAASLAKEFPELTLRVEPAHHEAYVELGPATEIDPSRWPLISETLRTWADEHDIEQQKLTYSPEDLGIRITYLAGGPDAATVGPDCDFAVPFV